MYQDDDDDDGDEMLVVSVSCNAQVSLSQNPARALQDSGKSTKFVTYVSSIVFFLSYDDFGILLKGFRA
jgi:hypothetical protein